MGVDLIPFANNWAYLKTELCWLDRLLMLAVARQRKETSKINKIANSKGDRVSAHWWKGIIAVSKPGYDDTRVPASTKIVPLTAKDLAQKARQKDRLQEPSPDGAKERKRIGYQQQLEGRIQASAQEKTVLALPSLRQYLNLTLFEKNLLLLTLAPEVNRRYGRLYHYLQTGEDSTVISGATASDLPTLDLALRLLCRNELERRRSRARLSAPGSLIEKRILHYVTPYTTTTRLNSYLQLNDDWIDYLLSEQPDQHVLFSQLATPLAAEKPATEQPPILALPAPTPATRAVKITQPDIGWDKVIFPTSLIAQLQTLGQQASASILTRYGSPPPQALAGRRSTETISAPSPIPGKVALLVGETGTGKTTAAGAMATSSRQPLCILDLQQVHPIHWKEVLESLEATRYPVLFIRSAALWFGRNSLLPKAELAQWLYKRQTSPGLTILGTRYIHTVKAHWRQQMDAVLTLPFPHKNARMMLWRQAFAGITCHDNVNWEMLAKQLKLSGGDIESVARDAIVIAQSKHAKAISLSHIQQALAQRDKAMAQAVKL
ncbi:MAG: hypothetical protein AAF703_04530 [Cyanobacteria bacterium P01_D01_bin.105]